MTETEIAIDRAVYRISDRLTWPDPPWPDTFSYEDYYEDDDGN